jgi:hypothetical protein
MLLVNKTTLSDHYDLLFKNPILEILSNQTPVSRCLRESIRP